MLKPTVFANGQNGRKGHPYFKLYHSQIKKNNKTQKKYFGFTNV